MEHWVVHLRNGVRIGNHLPLALIAGPCQLETLDHALRIASYLKRWCDELGIPYVFKASFDKANRTSGTSERGVGWAHGMAMLRMVHHEVGCPVTTDVHSVAQAMEASSIVDIVQIPAMLSRQTDIIVAAGHEGGRVNIKRNPGTPPRNMRHAAVKAEQGGAGGVLLTDRGSTFGYGDLVADMRNLSVMAETGHPVVFDASHSVQQAQDGSTGGVREYVPLLARAAVAVGVAAVFLECHPQPDEAPSDGPSMMRMDDVPALLKTLRAIDLLVKPTS